MRQITYMYTVTSDLGLLMFIAGVNNSKQTMDGWLCEEHHHPHSLSANQGGCWHLSGR